MRQLQTAPRTHAVRLILPGYGLSGLVGLEVTPDDSPLLVGLLRRYEVSIQRFLLHLGNELRPVGTAGQGNVLPQPGH